MIRWSHDGVEVAFTTRAGGVSEGPYASLNLGAATKDNPHSGISFAITQGPFRLTPPKPRRSP